MSIKTNQNVSSNVSSPEIAALRKEKEALLKQKTDLEQALALQASRKIQSEHDKAIAIKSKVEPVEQDTSGITVHRNTLTQADLVECQMLAILNANRTSKGLPPFKDYSAYLDTFTPASAQPLPSKSIIPDTKIDPVTPLYKLVELSLDYAGRPLRADGQVYLIVNGGYYICWNRSRCYIQRTDKPDVNILILGGRLYGDSILMSIIPDNSFRDLTRAEVDNIVQGKPSYSDLFKVYCKFCNPQNVYFDTKNALPIW